MSKFIQKLLPMDELVATVRRFPLSVLCALALFVIAFVENHRIGGFDDDLLGRIIAILGCLYFWFGISKLIAEGQKFSFSSLSLLNLVGGVAIILLIGTSTLWGMHLLYVMPALLLGIMFAPYLRGGDDVSFWFFNRQMWFGVLVSYAALILFAGGLSAALVAINILFGLDVGSKIYGDIWLFASLVLGPVYALSWVPKQFKFTPEDCNDPPGLQFIVNWISAPMVFVYMAILYAYFGKIIIESDVPNGHLAYLITGFVGAGVVTYMVAWPMRESGSAQLRAFYKIFFYAMIVPVGFHFFAIWERISAYGFTEQRYFLMLSAIWFAFIALGNLFKRMPIKLIPASLCVLLVFASFGPWGAVSLSGHSQYLRLISVMERNGLIFEGKVVKATETIVIEDRVSMSSILQYLCQTERDDMLRPLFEFETNCSGYELTKQLGFDFVHPKTRHSQGQMQSFWRSVPNVNGDLIDISAYDMIVRNINMNIIMDLKDVKPSRFEKKIDDSSSLVSTFDGKLLTLTLNSDLLAEVNISDYAAVNITQERSNDTLPYVEFSNSSADVRVAFTRMNGQIKDEVNIVSNFSFDLYYRLKR